MATPIIDTEPRTPSVNSREIAKKLFRKRKQAM